MLARRFDSVRELPAAYDAVFEQAARRSLFLSRPWFENFERTVVQAHDRTPVFALGGEGGAAVWPCWKPGPGHAQATRGLRALAGDNAAAKAASGLQGMANYYASLYGPVLAWPGAHGAEALAALVAALVHAPEVGHRVRFAPLPHDDGQLAAIEAAFRTQGWWTRRYFCFGNWYLPCQGMDYAAYLDTRPSALRNTLRRKQKRFDRLAGARLELCRDGAAIARGLDAFEQVYARSWKLPEPYPRFIPGLVHTLAAQGWLRLGVAWLDDEPVAAQIWAVCHGVASIYKLAYDAAYRELSAGSLLSAMLLRQVLDEGVREVDYLTGDDHYKRDWMSHRRERWGLAAFDPGTARGFAEGALNRMGNRGHQLWREVRRILHVAS